MANKTVNGKQCTILWHVDDLKISHVDPDVVTYMIKTIDKEFGQEAPITVRRGKVHDYLGMTLDFSTKGKAKIKMIDYVEGMLADLPVDMAGESATPAADHLFQVNTDDPIKLDKEKLQFFHHYVTKSLFLCKRGRPDIQTGVAFLCTRVRYPYEDDCEKLRKMLQYLRSTWRMYLTLEADDLRVIKWWVDASYAVHPDMRSHTGGTMTLNKVGVYSTLTRQKLNTKSSTESDLVGSENLMPQVPWMQYFMEAQGYGINYNVMYQDNQSTMRMEKNGRGSSGKRTRHIAIRYFFIADQISNKELRAEYCPTGYMVSDFFTKPLQVALFRRLRDVILNIYSGPSTSTQSRYNMSVLNEFTDGVQTWAQVVAQPPMSSSIQQDNTGNSHN